MLMIGVLASNTRSYQRLCKIHQFDAIAERVMYVASAHPRNITRLRYPHPSGLQLCNQSLVVPSCNRLQLGISILESLICSG